MTEGVSPLFAAYVYEPDIDAHRWRTFSRESLLDHIVSRRQKMGSLDLSPRFGPGLILRDWRLWWEGHGRSVRLARILGLENVSAISHETLMCYIEALGGDTP